MCKVKEQIVFLRVERPVMAFAHMGSDGDDIARAYVCNNTRKGMMEAQRYGKSGYA